MRLRCRISRMYGRHRRTRNIVHDGRDTAAVAPAADPCVKHIVAEAFYPVRDGRDLEKDGQKAGDEPAERCIRSGTELRIGFREEMIHGSQVDGHDGANKFQELFVGMAVRDKFPQGIYISSLTERLGVHGNSSF